MAYIFPCRHPFYFLIHKIKEVIQASILKYFRYPLQINAIKNTFSNDTWKYFCIKVLLIKYILIIVVKIHKNLYIPATSSGFLSCALIYSIWNNHNGVVRNYLLGKKKNNMIKRYKGQANRTGKVRKIFYLHPCKAILSMVLSRNTYPDFIHVASKRAT